MRHGGGSELSGAPHGQPMPVASGEMGRERQVMMRDAATTPMAKEPIDGEKVAADTCAVPADRKHLRDAATEMDDVSHASRSSRHKRHTKEERRHMRNLTSSSESSSSEESDSDRERRKRRRERRERRHRRDKRDEEGDGEGGKHTSQVRNKKRLEEDPEEDLEELNEDEEEVEEKEEEVVERPKPILNVTKVPLKEEHHVSPRHKKSKERLSERYYRKKYADDLDFENLDDTKDILERTYRILGELEGRVSPERSDSPCRKTVTFNQQVDQATYEVSPRTPSVEDDLQLPLETHVHSPRIQEPNDHNAQKRQELEVTATKVVRSPRSPTRSTNVPPRRNLRECERRKLQEKVERVRSLLDELGNQATGTRRLL